MNFGFSYIGLLFFLLLLIPNLIWTKNKPKNYEVYVKSENKFLEILERIGEVSVTCISLIFENFNFRLEPWSIFLGLAGVGMLFYEGYWIRYFRSEKQMKDFYTSYLGIPLAGATLPIFSYLMLSLYGKNIFLFLSTILLGIGHIGIHFMHYKEIKHLPNA